MRFNYPIIASFFGYLLLLNGFFMLTCLPFSVYYEEGDHVPILWAAIVTLSSGFLLVYFTKNPKSKDLKKRDGYLVVTLGWLIMSFFGTLPYLFSDAIPTLTDAFFETISGYSTTGASILHDVESVPKGILFWRSLTQWIGGMGIIVLTVAILPLLGIGGMQLFVAEAPGISPDKLQPRIKETAKRLWLIYIGLTLAETLILWFEDMTFFDAINHSLTTMATGGFSTKNASIAYFQSPFIHYTIVLFMFLAGTNFTITYLALHGEFKKVIQNEEFRFYTGFCVAVAIMIALGIILISNSPLERAFRNGLFQVVSIITTTGYVTADFTAWSPFITVVFFILMFIGGSAGSTAGGVKIVRHVVLIKNSILEFKRQIHPTAVIPVRLNKKAVDKDITFTVLAFIMIYISIFATGSVIMAMIGVDFETALGSVATCLGNIGPGIGAVGPMDNFAQIPDLGKWFLSGLMLLGRLELFTVLILFTPYFWRRQ
ncbi:MAG: TrkH family potassium uptake protein [Bacteroidetes bacterium]|nr:TrkH family potassium uptake protein [Bacteroidota bacterium]MDA1120328.1 TrkH family potassium uptake protein [Bacteroidota bacterium]